MGQFTYNDIVADAKGIARAYPFMFLMFSLLLGVVFRLDHLVCLVGVVLVSDSANEFVTKPMVYNILSQLGMLHVAARPKGAKNCGSFLDETNIHKTSKSYGMPSGHSLSSMIISFFLIGYIIDHHDKTLQRDVLIVFVCLMGVSICVSRVYLQCHTVLQVIIGGILGSIIGYYSYHGYKKLKQKYTITM